MQPVNISRFMGSASTVRISSSEMQSGGSGTHCERDSIVEAERRGNLVVAGLAFCLLSGVVALAVG